MLTNDQKAELDKKLDPAHVKQRKGGGNFQLSYIEGWHAIAEANRIFGHDLWHSETVELRCIGEEESGGRFKVGYLARVRITVNGPEDREDIIREGVGFGNGMGPSRVDAHELAAKEAETDARKRALMTFGWPFGLALYDKTQANVGKPDDKPEQPDDKPEQPDPSRAIAGPVKDLGEIEGNGTPSGPSGKAEAQANALRQARNLTELEQRATIARQTVRGWHAEEKAYVKAAYDEMHAMFSKTNPEMVP